MRPSCTGPSTIPNRLRVTLAKRAGRMTSISGSRPTIRVSEWCRECFQRHVVGFRMVQKHAIWYTDSSIHRVRKAVP